MEIVILSRPEAAHRVFETPKHFSHLVSIGSPSAYDDPGMPMELYTIPSRLRLEFEDISQVLPGYREPRRHDVEALIHYGRSMKDDAKVLVHCEAGISRSTAAGFILWCLKLDSERAAMQQVLKVRATALPNLLLVQYADAVLKREGRMIAEAEAVHVMQRQHPYW